MSSRLTLVSDDGEDMEEPVVLDRLERVVPSDVSVEPPDCLVPKKEESWDCLAAVVCGSLADVDVMV